MSKAGDLQIKFEVDPQFADLAEVVKRSYEIGRLRHQYRTAMIIPLNCPLAWKSGYPVHIWISWLGQDCLEEIFVRTIGLDGVY
jgi:hypothetical protein